IGRAGAPRPGGAGSTPPGCGGGLRSLARRRDPLGGLDEVGQLAARGAGVEVLVGHPQAFLRALGRPGHVEGEGGVEGEEVTPGPPVAAFEDVADDPGVERRVAALDVGEGGGLEAEVLRGDGVVLDGVALDLGDARRPEDRDLVEAGAGGVAGAAGAVATMTWFMSS